MLIILHLLKRQIGLQWSSRPKHFGTFVDLFIFPFISFTTLKKPEKTAPAKNKRIKEQLQDHSF
jgi:hypothetical protein